ncbi:MAG: OsmC family protein [Burkholderiaceae bacterium]|nr:OsmC family protein [Burkholderiaceae bacterium]MBP7658434.1 OsmC family protein [Burkholderiaceae bacterium]
MAQDTLFEGSLQWAGPSSGAAFSYDSFDRTTTIEFAGGARLQASAPAEFKGDDALCNPETLMLASLMQCHFLTFMAVASKSGATVLSYRDSGSGRLAMKDGRMRYVEVILRPAVVLADSAHMARLATFHDKAHANCFMANSVNFPVLVQPPAG